ncbi:ATP-binding protein [Bradyrhizobium amphicarpaeae]|uniref:histidine kinase n=1 Tax=Bradyrhizobium amphicarpaeae TaxID=1404768 RepID=A0A2U8PMF5_9BRAD|nr:ATP-binding protein [Bradyrhizobium amphicarpaeae]AWL98654.1 two-component sensor histidine kinase [Bradyrhizobium amphicarpaeae]
MMSLRMRLFLILVAATGVIWLFAIGWIYVGTKHEVEGVLDARLQEAARMVASLVPTKGVTTPETSRDALPGIPIYERQLSCQIWSLDGRLVARSRGAPRSRLSDTESGFSQREIDGESWRVFTVEDADKGIRVLVGDRLGIREHLVAGIIKGLLAPTLLIVPLLGFLIWSSLTSGLRPLRTLARELQIRDADDMSPVQADRAPAEILPMTAALNALFEKVESARRHEREITAFAAHELRTPLAGLQTQTQIAIGTSDQAVRERALRQILVAVDRTTRLVRQLLAMADLDACHNAPPDAAVNLGGAIEEIVDAVPGHDRVRVEIEPALRETTVTANAALLVLALRNLHENAVEHTSDSGLVRWCVDRNPDAIVIAVEDEGPGIPPDELKLVTRRFFRGRLKRPRGSGLGLSIVELALRANGARLDLFNRGDRSGLRAEIVWPLPSDKTPAQARRSGPVLRFATRTS